MFRNKLIITFIFLSSCIILAQPTFDDNPGDSSEPRSNNNIEIRLGLLSKFTSVNDINLGGLTIKYENKGLLGAVSYSRWLENNLALTVYGGILNASAQTRITFSTVNAESATVILLLLGIKYEPINLDASSKIRPYITVLAGPLFGHASNVLISNGVGVQSLSENAFAGFLGTGVDFTLSKLFMVGIRGGYYLASDFNSRIGFEKNYSSPEFSVSFGFLF